MSTLSGTTTCRTGSPRRTQTLAGATLVFYRSKPSDDASRWGWTPLDALPDGEIGRAVVAADGSFETDLNLDGGAVLVAAEVDRLAYAPSTDRTARGVLGTGAFGDDQALAIDLPSEAFCALLRALDLWLVAGNVGDCGQQPTPAAGATVSVFDRDITQDDPLGSDVADAAGEFEVFFTRADFHRIPLLPPPFDSILPHELFGGPDVYLRVELGGATLLDEDPARGRTTGRENRPHCTYLTVCVRPPSAPPPSAVTLWSHVGLYQVPETGDLKDFDADGFVADGTLAFAKSIDFRGRLATVADGLTNRFRFVFAEWADLGTAPAYPGDYAPLTATHITSAPYGQIRVPTGSGPYDYASTNVPPAPDADGWISGKPDPNFVDTPDRMIQLDTRTLVAAIDKSGPTTAGVDAPVPAGQRDRPRKVSFMLEVEAGGAAYTHPVPVVLHLNNSAVFARFEVQELTSNACLPVGPEAGGGIVVHPQYTVGHPYLGSISVQLQRQGGTLADVFADDHTNSAPGHGPLWTPPEGQHGTLTATYADVQPCSYRCWLAYSPRLTTGYSRVGGDTLIRTFCTS